MASLKTIAVVQANQGGAIPFPKLETSCRVCERVISVIKDIWPKKADVNVAFFTGASDRTARNWLNGSTRMSLENAAALLQTDDGYEILEAIMGPECKADWWLATKVAHEVRSTRRAIKREEARLAKARAQLNLLDE